MRVGLILGDQLSLELATLRVLDRDQDLVLLAEVHQEATYVKHHQQKIVLLFSAMRHFAEELGDLGWHVAYHQYEPDSKQQDLLAVLQQVCQQHEVSSVVMTESGEFRLEQAMAEHWPSVLGVAVERYQDDRFFCTKQEFAEWAGAKKQLRMEYFYREMRRKTGYLMVDNKPLGGQWNFDVDNRKAWRGQSDLPKQNLFVRDAIDREVMALVAQHFADHPGRLDTFGWATTRQQAVQALVFFLRHCLPHFGDFQDAMVYGEDRLFHSLLSPYLNCGLLTARQVCQAVLEEYDAGRVPLNAAEGFIRQVIGWREFIRGIYWLHMPAYAESNLLENVRALPSFYWSGQTRMACMAECFRNTFDNAYAHHIQRLMITGNFALLVGIMPSQICAWYLAVYADAYDWVELPNTLGMVMHADGGCLGSKPYAASGNYIHKMSNYCKHCTYNVKTQAEPDSCPFNSLYWHFIERHTAVFENNPRMKMIYRSFQKMDPHKQDKILRRAARLLENLEHL